MPPTNKRVICEICTADLGWHEPDAMTWAFVLHCESQHPDAYERIATAYDASKRHLPTDGLHL